MFKDQFGVGHLILAAQGSNAGKYYNPSTFGFFRDKIRVMENRTSANVKDLFLKFCNKNLPKMLKQEELKVKFDACGEAIIKEGESKIVLENLRYDKFGDFVVFGSFEPRYSITEKILDSEIKEITVDVELLDAQYKSTFLKDSEGQWCLVIKGTKMTSIKKDAKTKEIVIESNREQGNFTLVVRLPKGQKTEYNKKDLENGIVRYTIKLSENSEKDID
jgi:HSP20 family molecular chaperone IbpA